MQNIEIYNKTLLQFNVFYLNTFKYLIEFLASLLQSSGSHDLSEFILEKFGLCSLIYWWKQWNTTNVWGK